MDEDKIICPLCGIVTTYDHIIYDHKEYWTSKGLYNMNFPKTKDTFNERFSLIGLKIRDYNGLAEREELFSKALKVLSE